MNVIKTLWVAIQGDPKFMRKVNGWFTVFWIAMIPISFVMHWLSSVTFVSALSLWALVSGHWSAWQAARVEVAQAEEAKRRQSEDLPGKVVKRIISKTEISASTSASTGTGSTKRSS